MRRPLLPTPIMTAIGMFAGLLQAAAQPCDAPDAPAWIAHTQSFVLKYDQLAGFAVEHFGPPTSCEGKVTGEFDGTDFGMVRLRFPGGATFEMETQPPEASVASLTDSSGFDDETAVRDVLKKYTDEIGLEIDWSDTTFSAEGTERSETYWDPDDGMNASAGLVFRRDTLISVRVSLAL